MIVLTPAMARDLRYAVTRHQKTVGTYDYPRGDAVRLRTGPALWRRGLVEIGNVHSRNHSKRWRPTEAGLAYVAENFRGAQWCNADKVQHFR